MKKRIAVALSGGVDSSVAALLLKEQGNEVCGMTLSLWKPPVSAGGALSDEVADARRVCGHLGIEHRVVDLKDEFRSIVVDEFVGEYLAGRTPNPCIRCNERIKFGLLFERARSEGWDWLATGHYARVEPGDAAGRRALMLRQGKDPAKEQTYVLYRLPQKVLSRLVLPLGDLTKAEVRGLAERHDLPVSRKPESQEICFTAGSDYMSFLRGYRSGSAERIVPGPIVEVSTGRVLGRHRGIPFYTVGQRSGLGLTTPEPVFVTRIEASSNTLYVGRREEVFSRTLSLEQVVWAAGCAPERPLRCLVRIRRQHVPASAVVTAGERERADVVFDEPQMAVTPGQAAVFYTGGGVVGGGVIA